MTGAGPDPDELPQRAGSDERRVARGRLTIFFGAAPGVGKTYAMLEEAARHTNVVVGVVATHGRPETSSRLVGLERLPRRLIAHGASTLEELDLDAALARRPSILLLDELAHTNTAGARHVKRWQDAQELLEAGIDVFTTLNVQHVESVNDVVAEITGVVVKETVPDAIIDGAHEIKLIDLPPDELLLRLREGKVYVPAEATRAFENFFQKGNLLALRELALRKTAERVDAEMRAWRQAHGVERTWAASDRILVCIGPSPYSQNLLRVGRRMAASLHARWFAVNVETPATLRLGLSDRARISQNLRLAEQLGAETITLTGERAPEAILRYARDANVTKIVVGKPRVLRLRDRFGTSFLDELIVGSGSIDIYATIGDPDESEEVGPRPRPAARSDLVGYLASAAVVAGVSALALLVLGRSELADVVMTYLLGIVGISMWFGFRVSVAAAVASVLAFDFLFVPPYHRLAFVDLRHGVTFVVMLLVAVLITGLTQRVRDQAAFAQRNERRTSVLYGMSRELAHTEGVEAIARVAGRHLEQVFGSGIALLTTGAGGATEVAYATRGLDAAVEEDQGAIRWVVTHHRPAGVGTGTLPGSRGSYLPLMASGATGDALGVLGIYAPEPARLRDPEQQRLAESFAAQVAVAIERARLAEGTERARVAVEAEQLRNALLSSVSHDLRTPLAVMKGAASALVDDAPSLTAATRRELSVAVLEESERLDRLVRNLLDMTRLETGAVRLTKEWHSLQEIFGAAWGRMEPRLTGRDITVTIDSVLLCPCDGVLVEQLFINLLENAAKYTPGGSPLDVAARNFDDEVVVEVADRGAGVPLAERERIFDKFHRGSSARTQGGVGLGLTICRAIVVAHGGRIWVEDRAGGGAAFCFALPLTGGPPAQERLPEVGA